MQDVVIAREGVREGGRREEKERERGNNEKKRNYEVHTLGAIYITPRAYMKDQTPSWHATVRLPLLHNTSGDKI